MIEIYNIFRFLKKYGGYSYIEMENMFPFELEIVYYQVLGELKKELENKQRNSNILKI